MAEGEISTILQIFEAGGNIALLGFMVLSFYRGDVIAKSVLDRILAVYEQQLAEMTERILERLDTALSRDVEKL